MPAVLRAAEIAPFLFAKPLAFGDFPQTWTVNGGQTLTARAVRLDDFVASGPLSTACRARAATTVS